MSFTHVISHARRGAEVGAHTADAVRCVILTHADMPNEKCSCVCIIAHNYTPSQIYAYTLFTASTLIRI